MESTRLPGAIDGEVKVAIVPATEATVSGGRAAGPAEVVELEEVVEAVWEKAIFFFFARTLLERGRGNGAN